MSRRCRLTPLYHLEEPRGAIAAYPSAADAPACGATQRRRLPGLVRRRQAEGQLFAHLRYAYTAAVAGAVASYPHASKPVSAPVMTRVPGSQRRGVNNVHMEPRTCCWKR